MVVFIVLGTTFGPTSVMASNGSGGQRLWVARYNGSGDGNDVATAMTRSGDGSVIYVTGRSWRGSAHAQDYATVAYGADGVRRWASTYDGRAHERDVPTAIASGPARVYVTGASDGGATHADYVTIAYTSAGDRLWTKRYDGRGHGDDTAAAIAVSPDGSFIVVTGSTATIAYRSDGTRLWDRPVASGAAAAVSTDGSGVFITRVEGIGFRTIGIDATSGERLWSARFKGDRYHDGADIAGIAVSPDGARVYVGGGITGDLGGSGAYLIAYGADGSELWTKQYAPFAVFVEGMAIAPDGSRVYISGVGEGGRYVVGFDQDGHVRFESFPFIPYESEWVDAGPIVAGPGDTGVYLAGTTGSYEEPDIATFAIDPKGKQRWGVSYDGPGHGVDRPASIVVDPAGSVLFVAGGSRGLETGADFAIVAYRTD